MNTQEANNPINNNRIYKSFPSTKKGKKDPTRSHPKKNESGIRKLSTSVNTISAEKSNTKKPSKETQRYPFSVKVICTFSTPSFLIFYYPDLYHIIKIISQESINPMSSPLDLKQYPKILPSFLKIFLETQQTFTFLPYPHSKAIDKDEFFSTLPSIPDINMTSNRLNAKKSLFRGVC